jgi:phage-related protein
MPAIGKRCHELRVTDKAHEWRIVYRIDGDAIVIGEVFEKKTTKTPRNVIERCQQRFEAYDRVAREGKQP